MRRSRKRRRKIEPDTARINSDKRRLLRKFANGGYLEFRERRDLLFFLEMVRRGRNESGRENDPKPLVLDNDDRVSKEDDRKVRSERDGQR